jgi:TolB-like protein
MHKGGLKMKFEKYLLTEDKKEKVDYVNKGKVLQTTQVVRVSNQTIKTKNKVITGYFEDKYGHRYTYDSTDDKGWSYYTMI